MKYVVIVSAHPLVRLGLHACLVGTGEELEIHEVASFETLAVREDRFDVAIVDTRSAPITALPSLVDRAARLVLLAELRRLTAKDVFQHNRVAPSLQLPSSSPRSQGVYEIPITSEFSRALTALRSAQPRLRRSPQSPLLVVDPEAKLLVPLSRKGLTRVVQRLIVRAGIRPDRQLGPGSLRKRFAQKIWVAAEHDMLILRDALHVWSVIQAMEFLALDAGRIDRAMQRRFRIAA